jgi:hypothetical protein
MPDAPRPNVAVINQRIATMFNPPAQAPSTTTAPPLPPVLRGGNVRVDSSGVAVVQGIASSDRQRKLAAFMASLEPGVREVKNEVKLAPAPTGSSQAK